jgi:hypothetical protein
MMNCPRSSKNRCVSCASTVTVTGKPQASVSSSLKPSSTPTKRNCSNCGGLAEALGMSVNEATASTKKTRRLRVFIVNLFLECEDVFVS